MTNGTRRGEGLASRPGRFLPPGKTRYPLYRRLGGPQARFEEVRKISPPPRLDPRTVQPVATRYNDWAIRPTMWEYYWICKLCYRWNKILSLECATIDWARGRLVLDCVWNVMAHAQKPDFAFRRNGRVHLTLRLLMSYIYIYICIYVYIYIYIYIYIWITHSWCF